MTVTLHSGYTVQHRIIPSSTATKPAPRPPFATPVGITTTVQVPRQNLQVIAHSTHRIHQPASLTLPPMFLSSSVRLPRPAPQSHGRSSPAGGPLRTVVPRQPNKSHHVSVLTISFPCMFSMPRGSPGPPSVPGLLPGHLSPSLCSGKSSERPHLFPPQASTFAFLSA